MRHRKLKKWQRKGAWLGVILVRIRSVRLRQHALRAAASEIVVQGELISSISALEALRGNSVKPNKSFKPMPLRGTA